MPWTLAALVILLTVCAARAEDRNPRLLGVFKDWSAHLDVEEGGGLICFMVSRAIRQDPAVPGRRDAVIFVTHRAAEAPDEFVNIVLGHVLQRGVAVQVGIGERVFAFSGHTATAMARSDEDDRALIAAMRTELLLFVNAVSQDGIPTMDAYSLVGFSQAHDAVKQACFTTPLS